MWRQAFSERNRAGAFMTMPKSELPSDITDFDCWIEARQFVHLIYQFTGGQKFLDDTFLRDLIRRHSIALMSKLSDGHHRRSTTYMCDCLEQVKGHLGKIISHLY